MVETYSNRIYRLALRYTGDREEAEDLTQETFLRVYKNLSKFDRSKSAGPWIFKIATNLCRNYLRQRNRVFFEEDSDALNLKTKNSPEALFIEKEAGLEIAAALDELPLSYREIILLKTVAGLSYKQIGETLDLNLSLVKNRLYRGRIMLKKILEERE